MIPASFQWDILSTRHRELRDLIRPQVLVLKTEELLQVKDTEGRKYFDNQANILLILKMESGELLLMVIWVRGTKALAAD